MKSTGASETCDSILGGRIRVIQPRKGYRFSADAILLGRFVRVRNGDRVLELGAGSGVITMMVAALNKPREAVALEIQPEMVAMIRRSALLNGLDAVRAIEADLRQPSIADLAPNSFDLVIANPPYRAIGAGRESPECGRRLARSESSASLEDFVAAASRYAREGGRTAFVFLADRAAELLSTMRARRLEPKRLRFVHPYIDARATALLVEARKGGGVELSVEAPLVLHEAPGVYTREAREMLGIA